MQENRTYEKKQEKSMFIRILKRILKELYFWLILNPALMVWNWIKPYLMWIVALGVILNVLNFARPYLKNFFGDEVPFFLKLFIFCLPLCVTLTSCSSTDYKPAQVGTGTDDLKQSPCESCKKKPFYENGRWILKK